MTFEQLKEAVEEPRVTIAAGSFFAEIIFPIQLIGWKKGVLDGRSLHRDLPTSLLTDLKAGRPRLRRKCKN